MSVLNKGSGDAAAGDVDARDRRALVERMIVLPEAPGLFRVWSNSRSYLVDLRGGACECEDSVYRGETCKHQRRVQYALGAKDIPPGVPPREIDPLLGEPLRRADS